VWWGPNKHDLHSPSNKIYDKYPAKVLWAFSDAFGENVPKDAEFMTWPRLGVVKVVLEYMLACCDGDGVKPVKEIELNLDGMISAKNDGEFSRFFRTAYLFDFAQEYKIKHLEDKLKRELEFMAKVDDKIQWTIAFFTDTLQGKYPLKVEEVFDMANYFWQPNRDDTAIKLMIDSIARNIVKGEIKGGRLRMYQEELGLWTSETKEECTEDCEGEEFCVHDDLPEMLERRIKYFEDPKKKEELEEVFGKKADVVEDANAGGDGGWGDDGNGGGGGGGSNDWDTAPKTDVDGDDKENQAPAESWGDEMNNAAAPNEWETSAPAGNW
jgi:hypothetical protein